MNNKIKTIVCGTTFGQFYCEALRELSDIVDFCGIFARGSLRSVNCAQKYNVKLYTDVEEIDEDIKLACVVTRSGVLGGNGTTLALKLLERGINVIQEQPVHFKDIEECAKVAKKNGVFYRVGNLYKMLNNVRCFVETAQKICKQAKPVFLDIGCASQVSYPLFEIISEMLGNCRPFKIGYVSPNDRPYQNVQAEISGIPVCFQVQNQVNPNDPDNFMNYLFKLELITDMGRLVLGDVMGGVSWYNKMFVPVQGEGSSAMSTQSATGCITIYPAKMESFEFVFTKRWIPAIGEDIREFIKMIHKADSSCMNKYYTRTIGAARLWHGFTSEIGFPTLIAPERLPTDEVEGVILSVQSKYIDK